jgi:F-type H+-transporting ATPase subunit gamma
VAGEDTDDVPAGHSAGAEGESSGSRGGYFEFEPAPEDLLALLVPRYAEAALYAALLEASASEHIARQRAMSAATENADELIKNLRRVMNRARQDTITSEIMEIVGGAEALRTGSGREAAQPMNYDAEERSA